MFDSHRLSTFEECLLRRRLELIEAWKSVHDMMHDAMTPLSEYHEDYQRLMQETYPDVANEPEFLARLSRVHELSADRNVKDQL